MRGDSRTVIRFLRAAEDGLLGRFRACPAPSTVLPLFNVLKLGNLHYHIRKHHGNLEFSAHGANVVPQSRHVHVGGWDTLLNWVAQDQDKRN